MSLSFKVVHQSLPLSQVFRISRGAKTTAEVIVVLVTDGTYTGWGEAVPYQRYGESIESVILQIRKVTEHITENAYQNQLEQWLPSGSARNALDCAMWDLRAKQQSCSVNEILKLPLAPTCITAQTISLGSVHAMQQAALKLTSAPLIKIKLDGQEVLEKMQKIHSACPNSHFIIDANEAWQKSLLEKVLAPLSKMNVVLIEQPLPAEQDDELLNFASPIPICADESCHASQDLDQLVGKYSAINIKLDKTGGLTEAVKLLHRAKTLDFQIMVGCMVGSSLAMAPAYALCGMADFVDLDGPLLVAKDRVSRFTFDNGVMSSIPTELWGMGNVNDPDITALS